ncbi:retention module-containing protein [Billgrantia sp. C5P2]|uniref:retention module-containing protein n=1 Tax=Billgrantia sp. C5P2 TaxID=3436239 RepID=UPI004058E3C0
MSIAIVLSISGQAWARDASGNLRELRVGDALQEGETVVTSNGGDVQLDFGDNLDPTLIEGGEQVVMTQELGADQSVDASEFAALDEDLEALLAALDDESIDLLDVLDATAAGAGPGGAADGGHSFVRLARIAEDVDPLIFNFGLNDLGGPPEEQGGAFLLAETEVEEPEVPVVIAPTAESFDATLLDIETLNEPGSVASGILPFTFGSGSGGTVTFAAMDGVVLQVGGETLTFSWNAGTSTLQAVSEARGITIFSIEINPSTGAFTVTQVNSLLHGEGMDEALASLVYTVSSSSGSATGTLQLTIVDDAPRALDDSANTGEDTPVTVNVMANDTGGADGATLTAASLRNPSQGTLSFAANGQVTFTPAPGFEGDAVIDYTITDADGDTASATLTVTVAPDSVPVIAINADSDNVDEAGLPNGSAAGDGSHVTSGTFNLDTGNDGLASLVINGVNVTAGGTVQGSHGSLVVTLVDGSYSWTYTLDGATDGDTTSDSFTLVVTDSDGSTATDSFTVDIVDDVPVARDDTASTGEDTPITVNVMANDTAGADGATLTAASLRNPSQGTLSFAANGQVTFTPAPGFEGDAVIDYTITDADGDTASATLTVTVAPDSVPVIAISADSDSVAEAGLPNGSAAGDGSHVTSGTFNLDTGNDGLASLVINGVNVTGGGTVTGSHGSLVVTPGAGGSYSWTYTLTGPTSGDTTSDSFTLVVTDSDGSTATDSFTVDIVDDVPVARDDTASTGEDTPITVNVMANDTAGADGATLTAASLRNPSQGTLSFAANGQVTFTPAPGFEGDAVIDYTITDADGDTASATLTVTVAPDSVPVIAINADSDSVDEAGLPNGSAAGDGSHVTSGTFNLDTGNDGLASLVINGVNVTGGGTVTGSHGSLVVTPGAGGSYSWTYTLNGATSGDTTSDSFTLVVTDSDGSTATDSFTVDIVDDVPVAANDNGGTVTEDAAVNELSGNVLVNDSFGADGPVGGTASVSWNVSAEELAEIGKYGTLVLNTDGSWSFTLDNSLAAVQALNASDLLNFNLGYTITDADGDTASATLSLAIQGANDSAQVTVNVSGADSTVHEAGLTSEADTRESASGSFQVAATDGITSVTVGGQSFTLAQLQGFTAASPSVGIVTSMGMLYLTGYSGSATAGTVSYTYTLSEAQAHGAPGSSTDGTLIDSVALGVSGVGGSSGGANLSIAVIDDAPVLNVTNAVSLNAIGVSFTGTLADIGADFPGSVTLSGTPPAGLTSGGKAVTYQLSAGGSVLTATAGGQAVFKLTAHPDGTYTYEQFQPLDLAILNSNLQGSVGASGPQLAYFIYEDGTFGSNASAKAWSVKITGSGNVNPSTQGMGIGNNLFETGEKMRLDFDNEGASGTVNLAYVAKIGINGLDGSETVAYTVKLSDGTSLTGIATSASLVDGSLFITASPGTYIDYVDLVAGHSTSVRITSISTFTLDDGVPKNLEFGFTATDADGDSVTGSLSVTVQNSNELSGNADDNIIAGGAGAQTLSGGAGNDTLIGGAGNDTLIGGDGDDVFQWNFGDQGTTSAPAIDTVKDFGHGEDVLDLADLLQNEGVETIDSFIVAAQQGSDTVLYINHEGGINVDGSNATQVIVLENYSMGEVSSADFLQEMLENGQLHIDQ